MLMAESTSSNSSIVALFLFEWTILSESDGNSDQEFKDQKREHK